jgi:hypothetical protein
MSEGDLYLQDQGSSTITITQVSLAGRGTELTGAALIPGLRGIPIGSAYGYPPEGINPKLWAAHRSPDGYQLEPGKVAALVVGVAPTTDAGGTGYPVISYAYDGSRYVLKEAWGARVSAAANC